MKKLLSIVLWFLMCMCTLTVTNAQNSRKATIYKLGEFLIATKDTMKIVLIDKSKSSKRESNVDDILYEDDKYLIVGDTGKMGWYEPFGVYRKHKLQYHFADFKTEVYKGKLAAPNFKSDAAALTFRTQIKTQCKTEGVNFAGHYTIIHWGCGSSCESIAIVDRINGKIFYSDLVKAPYDVFYTFKCRSDSKMIIMNDWLLSDIYKGYIFCSALWPLEIGTWNGSKLKFISVSSLKLNVNLKQ